jgi:hypothetical protein
MSLEKDFPELFNYEGKKYPISFLTGCHGEDRREILIGVARMIYRACHADDPKQESTQILKEILQPILKDDAFDDTVQYNGIADGEHFPQLDFEAVLAKQIIPNIKFFHKWCGELYAWNQLPHCVQEGNVSREGCVSDIATLVFKDE